ncbi:hypothetical protein SAMN02983003_3363 [Devosia enhydra]|uniref:Ammonia monooxygenase n=1 Tax=Devosia enhydra TaxID=665118 RepID=A0A1K2I343_9HYPH|nr:AbrB family transcriptional regulator [Devosia enhydra]SFZ86188.1 hypothetical protein SAMN02983003_3363 [Devosia enhydra]
MSALIEPIKGAGPTLLALAISATGGGLAQAAGMPAGWLIGGMISVAIAALAGAPVAMPGWLRDIAFVLVGLVMGGNVARDSLTLIVQWPVTMLALAIELALIISATGWALQKLFRLDPGTSFMSAFPGHLSFVMAIASAGVGNSRQIAIIQVVRILFLTASAPLALLLFSASAPQGPVEPQMAIGTLVAVGAACALTGFVFTRLRVPAGYVLGAMFMATTARLTGNFEGALPPAVTIAAFVLIGCNIAIRLKGITGSEFRGALLAGLVATIIAVGITTVMAIICAQFVDMPFGHIWLGLSPGALEGMGALGIAMGFDTAFIAAHHVTRLLILTISIPLVVMLVRRHERKRL